MKFDFFLVLVNILQHGQLSNVQYFEDSVLSLRKNDVTFTRVTITENDSDQNQICNILTSGFGLILDFTWSGNEMAQELVKNMSLPYLHVDVSISPFLVLLDSYLDSRNSTDVLVIFDKEECKFSVFFPKFFSTALCSGCGSLALVKISGP